MRRRIRVVASRSGPTRSEEAAPASDTSATADSIQRSQKRRSQPARTTAACWTRSALEERPCPRSLIPGSNRNGAETIGADTWSDSSSCCQASLPLRIRRPARAASQTGTRAGLSAIASRLRRYARRDYRATTFLSEVGARSRNSLPEGQRSICPIFRMSAILTT